METKYVRVPFSVELAKEITNGTKEGRIVTSGGRKVRIVCWDFNNGVYNLIGLATGANGFEDDFFYTESGRLNPDEKSDLDLMLEIPEYMTFKDGDVYKTENGSIGVYCCSNKTINNNVVSYCVGLRSFDNELCFYNEKLKDGFGVLRECTLDVTAEEKQKLIDALKQSDDPRTKEFLKKLGIEEDPKFNFKPFDKVVVRENDSLDWEIDLFMKYEKEFETYRCMTGRWKQCLPFNEETEHLIGTTKSYNSK